MESAPSKTFHQRRSAGPPPRGRVRPPARSGRRSLYPAPEDRPMHSVALGDGPTAYLRLLRHGPAVRPFLAACLARLPMSVGPLGMLLLVEHSRGSYALAGLVTGAYAIGVAVGSPLWGRAMDRTGQRQVLIPTS